MILPPYLEGPEDDDGLFAFYEAIDAAVETDIIGYNIPQTTGIGISVDLFKRLNQLEHFKYIKDSAGDLARHQEYLATGYRVLNGCDPNTVFSFIAGAHQAVSGVAQTTCRAKACACLNWSPAMIIGGAMELWSRMVPSLLYIWRGNYVPKVKAASRLRGFDGGGVRAPLQDLSVDELGELAASLEPLG